MLKIQEIREIIKLIDQSSIDKFSYEADGAKIKLSKSADKNKVVVEEVVQVVQEVPTQTKTQPVVAEAPTPVVTAAPISSEETQSVKDENLHEVVSPMVGTFYAASSPEAAPFVEVGQKVQAESIVCIVEAMKLFNEIESEVSGEIVEILVKDGQLVEYGQPLFLVKSN